MESTSPLDVDSPDFEALPFISHVLSESYLSISNPFSHLYLPLSLNIP